MRCTRRARKHLAFCSDWRRRWERLCGYQREIIISPALIAKSSVSRLASIALIAIAAACSHHADLHRSEAQDNFGVQMARMNLWREALFRFQRAVQINPQDAMARNNLAVAFEANGDFERARKEYLEALKLDRSNQYIQKNYSRFVEFLSRNRKRQKDVKTASAAPATEATPSPVVTSTQPPPATSTQPPPAPQPQPPPPGGAR